jgi:hypothetical protein
VGPVVHACVWCIACLIYDIEPTLQAANYLAAAKKVIAATASQSVADRMRFDLTFGYYASWLI